VLPYFFWMAYNLLPQSAADMIYMQIALHRTHVLRA
jgi:hypothetical protein